MKLGTAQKYVISGFLKSSIKQGINEFIIEQKEEKVKELMDDIQKSVSKRGKEKDSVIATELVTKIFFYTGKWIEE